MKEIRNKKIINTLIGFLLFLIILFGGFYFIGKLFVKEVKANEDVPIYDTNINIPTSDMTNDVWLNGNMISDMYYRYDIKYDNFTYVFLEEIQQAYIDEVIPTDTLLYIDLNPMYNFIFAKLEDQGNGLYYWSEHGTLNPENPSTIKTIIINKNGLSYKNANYDGYWQEYLWDDFDTNPNVLGNSLIGYENQTSSDYYDYYNGYQDGYWDGRQYGFDLGRKSGLQSSESIGYDKGRNDFGIEINGVFVNAQDYGNMRFDDGFILATDENYTITGMVKSVFVGLGSLLSIQLLPNISIGAIIAVPIVFGIIAFIVGRKKE